MGTGKTRHRRMDNFDLRTGARKSPVATLAGRDSATLRRTRDSAAVSKQPRMKRRLRPPFFLSRRPLPRWTCGQPAAPNPVHRVHQGDLRARNLLFGKFRAREPGIRSSHVAPIILPANSGRNIVAGDAPTASLAFAAHRLLNAWRQLIRLFSSLRLFSRRKARPPGTVLRRQKPAQKKTAPGAIGDRR